MATPTRRGKSTSYKLLFGISSLLIVTFLWNVFVPGGEWPLPPSHYISMGLDLLMVVALIFLKTGINDDIRADPSLATSATLFFWFGMIAGIGQLLIRFTSDQAWWTGHLRDGL